MKTAIYARVSTAEQSSAMQLEELRAYCHHRGWAIIEEFVDEGVSGGKESRPSLNRLLADAKRRKFDAVLVYRFDRFARSLKQLVNALSDFNVLARGGQFANPRRPPPPGGLWRFRRDLSH
jgi:DNA invertase Pin-like site-specific DNA recombinase